MSPLSTELKKRMADGVDRKCLEKKRKREAAKVRKKKTGIYTREREKKKKRSEDGKERRKGVAFPATGLLPPASIPSARRVHHTHLPTYQRKSASKRGARWQLCGLLPFEEKRKKREDVHLGSEREAKRRKKKTEDRGSTETLRFNDAEAERRGKRGMEDSLRVWILLPLS